MNPDKPSLFDSLFEVVGTISIFLAAATLVLCIANVRSHLKYGSPNYHLEWVVTYLLLTGIGVLRRKRWGVLLSFGPALLIASATFVRPSAPWIVALAWVAALAAIPVALSRKWKSLSWT